MERRLGRPVPERPPSPQSSTAVSSSLDAVEIDLGGSRTVVEFLLPCLRGRQRLADGAAHHLTAVPLAREEPGQPPRLHFTRQRGHPGLPLPGQTRGRPLLLLAVQDRHRLLDQVVRDGPAPQLEGDRPAAEALVLMAGPGERLRVGGVVHQAEFGVPVEHRLGHLLGHVLAREQLGQLSPGLGRARQGVEDQAAGPGLRVLRGAAAASGESSRRAGNRPRPRPRPVTARRRRPRRPGQLPEWPPVLLPERRPGLRRSRPWRRPPWPARYAATWPRAPAPPASAPTPRDAPRPARRGAVRRPASP